MRLFQLAQNALRMPVQRFTGRRSRNTLPTPEQQLSTKIILERGYLLAQSGLRDTEQLRRAGQTACIDDTDEGF